MIASIIAFAVQFLNINIASRTGKANCSSIIEFILIFLFLGSEAGLLIALIVMYASTISSLSEINVEML
jgi:hypothetical protein